MRASSPNGTLPYVWDQNSDVFDHNQLAANWDAADAAIAAPRTTNAVTQTATLPVGLNNTTDRGKIYYLTATDQGFPAGTIARWTGSAWQDIRAVELQSTLPVTNLFDGRMVLLTASASGFAAWSLVRYQSGSWYIVNQGVEIVAGTFPIPNNFAGRVVVLSTAGGGFKAWDVIRYDGSTWSLVGPQPIPPATEMVYASQTVDLTTTNAVAPGDTITTFSAATFENVKYYLEVNVPRLTHTATGDVRFQLRESGGNVGNPLSAAVQAGITTDFFTRLPFTPTAAAHTYSLTWYVSVAGTATIGATGFGPATFRIVKA
jgi:hypothetical protein